MPKDQKIIQKSDLLAPDVYEKNRRQMRKELVEFKKDRRVPLGPYATFYFECYETMLAQVQEMLHIEKGGDEQLNDELTAYNPLIPNGKELVSTLMFEIDNPVIRATFLGKLGGVEENVFISAHGNSLRSLIMHIENLSSEQILEREIATGKPLVYEFDPSKELYSLKYE